VCLTPSAYVFYFIPPHTEGLFFFQGDTFFRCLCSHTDSLKPWFSFSGGSIFSSFSYPPRTSLPSSFLMRLLPRVLAPVFINFCQNGVSFDFPWIFLWGVSSLLIVHGPNYGLLCSRLDLFHRALCFSCELPRSGFFSSLLSDNPPFYNQRVLFIFPFSLPPWLLPPSWMMQPTFVLSPAGCERLRFFLPPLFPRSFSQRLDFKFLDRRFGRWAMWYRYPVGHLRSSDQRLNPPDWRHFSTFCKLQKYIMDPIPLSYLPPPPPYSFFLILSTACKDFFSKSYLALKLVPTIFPFPPKFFAVLLLSPLPPHE